MSKPLENDALVVLRAMFDLIDANVCPTLDLVSRLWGIKPSYSFALITHLREEGLMQSDRLGLTLRGLAMATALPPAEPRSMETRPTLIEAA